MTEKEQQIEEVKSLREAEIADLKEALTACFGADPMYYGVDADQIANGLYEEGCRLLGGWIDVNIELPAESGRYLVRTGFRSYIFTEYSTKHQLFNVYDYDSLEEVQKFAFKNVSHWMPLSEPPKMMGGI